VRRQHRLPLDPDGAVGGLEHHRHFADRYERAKPWRLHDAGGDRVAVATVAMAWLTDKVLAAIADDDPPVTLA